MARARSIDGPYALHPNVHLITSKDAPEAPLQRAGHGQIVETPDGQTYHTHLCSRPLAGLRRSPLGRETAIQKCVWGEDDWLYLQQGGQVPAVEVPAPFATAEAPAPKRQLYRFDKPALPLDFQWLRTPESQRIFSLEARPGWLRLIARESLGSWFEQSLVARRQQHFAYRAETEFEFAPRNFQQCAGLVAYYNRCKFHALAVTWDDARGRLLTLMSCNGDYPMGRLSFSLASPIPLGDAGPVKASVRVDGASLQFAWASPDGWRDVGPVLDASILSDEAGGGEHGSFTGAFVGMFAFDTSGEAMPADFRSFEYEGGDPRAP
jgi:xylan 1,4-beta-xylosidase